MSYPWRKAFAYWRETSSQRRPRKNAGRSWIQRARIPNETNDQTPVKAHGFHFDVWKPGYFQTTTASSLYPKTRTVVDISWTDHNRMFILYKRDWLAAEATREAVAWMKIQNNSQVNVSKQVRIWNTPLRALQRKSVKKNYIYSTSISNSISWILTFLEAHPWRPSTIARPEWPSRENT